MTSQNTSQVISSHRDDGIVTYTYPASMRSELWDYIFSRRVQEHEGQPVRPNIYYCQKCNIVFILPGWYTSYYLETKLDPRYLLEKFIKCCNHPVVFYLTTADQLDKAKSRIGMIFQPFLPCVVWDIPDGWVTSSIVADELL